MRRKRIDAPRNAVIRADSIRYLRTLKTKSVDHTIMDPPYEDDCHISGKTIRWPKDERGRSISNLRETGRGSPDLNRPELDFAAMDEEHRLAIARQVVRVTRGWALVFCQDEGVHLWRAALCDPNNHPKGPAKWRRTCVWVKPDAMPKVNGDGPGQGHECFVAVWCGDGRSVWNGGGSSGVFIHNTGRNEFHPNQKPLSLMRDLVINFTMHGELILDPYAGSGSTLVAAKEAGRSYLGIEMQEKHVSTCERRLTRTAERTSFEMMQFSTKKTKTKAVGIEEKKAERLSFDAPPKKKRRKPRRA